MSKTLLWIDDSIELILEVIQGVIVDSWKLGEESEDEMRTRILIFGDACLERDSVALWGQADENKMNLDLFDLFIDECEDMEGPTIGNETAKKNLHLIEKAIQIVFKKEDAEEDHNLYNTARKIWKKELNSEKGPEEKDYEQAKKYVTEIIERMHIEETAGTAENSAVKKEETIIGIDLELLSGDLERARDNKRIISMEIYHQLSEKQYPCFIYSSHADDNQLIEAWKNTYKRLYKDEKPVTTYERSDFNKKGRENMISHIETDLKKIAKF